MLSKSLNLNTYSPFEILNFRVYKIVIIETQKGGRIIEKNAPFCLKKNINMALTKITIEELIKLTIEYLSDSPLEFKIDNKNALIPSEYKKTEINLI
jgi:hypothetical protein